MAATLTVRTHLLLRLIHCAGQQVEDLLAALRAALRWLRGGCIEVKVQVVGAVAKDWSPSGSTGSPDCLKVRHVCARQSAFRQEWIG